MTDDDYWFRQRYDDMAYATDDDAIVEDWARGPQPISISSGHFSLDTQLSDAITYLEHNHPDDYKAFLAEFPEWTSAQWQTPTNSWLDTTAMGVDDEWSSWAIDWLEANTPIMWEDGEPWWTGEHDA